MTTEDFVRGFKVQKDEMLEIYFSEPSASAPSPVTHAGTYVRSMSLNPEQLVTMRKILDLALTDAFYSILLAFDGCARLGDLEQQSFQIQAEDGSLVCRGDGKLEGLAYESFHKGDVA
jgi:hypothetical protein